MTPVPSDAARAEKLFGILSATDAQGRSRYGEEELVTFLPLLMKSSGLTIDDSETLRRLFDRVGEYIGAVAGDTDEQLTDKLSAYYRAHPPSKSLQEAFGRFFREEAGGVTRDGFDALMKSARKADRGAPIGKGRAVFDVSEPDSKE